MSEPRIFLSAGEASGDLHGAALVQALRQLYPDAELLGLAGPRMAQAGVRPVVEFERLVVMGFAEVVSRLPFFLSLRQRVGRMLAEKPPDLLIPIDYPGFNMWLSKVAHRRGIPVLYYIAPQVWAWRQGRARTLAETTDRVAVVFPQEEPFLQNYGVAALFVGHPLLDRMAGWRGRDEAISRLGADPHRPILGVLPGSRPQEVRRHLAPFLEVARHVLEHSPQVQVIVSGASNVPSRLYSSAADYRVISDSGSVLSAATAVLSKSGTTTIEATLRGTPLVIAHRVHPLTYLLARRLVRVDSIGMVNLLAGQVIVPEFVQELPPERIARELLVLLDASSPKRASMVEALSEVRKKLGQPGASGRVAGLAMELLDGQR